MLRDFEQLTQVLKDKPEKLDSAIREAIDHVLWTGYTGFTQIDHLSKPEKTIIGTCVERAIRKEFAIPLSRHLDLEFADGSYADIKTTCRNNWMIPRECVGHMCLLVKVSDTDYSIGVFKAEEDLLNNGANQDKKRSISANGKKQINWIVTERAYKEAEDGSRVL